MNKFQNLAVGSVVCVVTENEFCATTTGRFEILDIFREHSGDTTIYGSQDIEIYIKHGYFEAYDDEIESIVLKYPNNYKVSIKILQN